MLKRLAIIFGGKKQYIFQTKFFSLGMPSVCPHLTTVYLNTTGWWAQYYHSPHFSTNVVNAVNFQVNFRNLHHSLQGLKLSCLQLIFEEDVNIDLDLI